MIKNSNRIQVPAEERISISPQARKIAFKQIYTGYKEKFPLKLIYAFLNFNPDEMVDYAVVYSGRNESDTGNLILFDIVPIHSDRCTPAYRYYKRIHKEENFFRYGIEEMVVIENEKFYEFLTNRLSLSLDKESDMYWKKSEHANEVCKWLLDLSLYYTKKEVIPFEG